MKKSKLLALFAFIGWVSCIVLLSAVDMRLSVIAALYFYSQVLDELSKLHKENGQ